MLLIASAVTLGACSGTRQELEVSAVQQEIPRPTVAVIPKPDPIYPINVTWVIVKTENGEVLALTREEFEMLQLNIAEVLRYVKEANAQLDYYRAELQ